MISNSGDGGKVRTLPATPPADHPIGSPAATARCLQRDRRHRSFS
jgi:hypothetical protein